MTFPSPQMPVAPGLGQPQKLSWVTVPLIIQMVLLALSIVVLPLLIPLFNAVANSPEVTQDASTSPESLRLALGFISGFVWVIELFNIALLVLYFFTYRGVQQGRSWARVVAIIVFILALLNFPIGTALGIFGLIGAFDAEVTAYCNR